MMDAMRPASEAVRPRGQEATDEANEAARMGQNEAGPREAGEAAAMRPTEADRPAGLNQAGPMGQDGVRPGPVFAASASASRIVAKGQRRKEEAEAEAIRLEAETAQRLRLDEAKDNKEAKERDAKEAARKARREAMGRTVGRVLEAAQRGVAYVRENADAVYSMGVYGAVVTVAASSQAQVAHDQFHWSWERSIAGAAFIEGLSLAFALTAHKLRLQGEKAWFPRLMTASAAGFGAYVNYIAHINFPGLSEEMSQVLALVLAASSVAGIVLWEVRTAARTRKEMRKAEKKAAPKAQLGLDLLFRYPGTWFWAWSAMIANPRVRTREDALRVGLQMRADRRQRKEQEAARREAIKVDAEVRRVASKAALKAAKSGEAGLALAHLAHLAHSGTAALEARLALEAGPSAPEAGPTIEGSLVASGPMASEAGTRPQPHGAGLTGPASSASASRPQAREAGPTASASSASGLTPRPREAGLANGGSNGADREAGEAGGPMASPGEAAASGREAGEATLGDLGAARTLQDARVNELDLMFPDRIPSRGAVKTLVKQMEAAGEPPINKWTSNRDIDNAIKGLRQRRAQAA